MNRLNTVKNADLFSPDKKEIFQLPQRYRFRVPFAAV